MGREDSNDSISPGEEPFVWLCVVAELRVRGKSLLPCFVLRRRHTGKQDAEECVSGENDLRVKLCVALRTNVRYNKIIVNALNSWGKT